MNDPLGSGSPPDRDGAGTVLVSWNEAAGVVRSVGPFPRRRAEALVAAYRRLAPQREWWVEALPREVAVLRLGRLSRRRVHR
jgi:hypothetical protein